MSSRDIFSNSRSDEDTEATEDFQDDLEDRIANRRVLMRRPLLNQERAHVAQHSHGQKRNSQLKKNSEKPPKKQCRPRKLLVSQIPSRSASPSASCSASGLPSQSATSGSPRARDSDAPSREGHPRPTTPTQNSSNESMVIEGTGLINESSILNICIPADCQNHIVQDTCLEKFMEQQRRNFDTLNELIRIKMRYARLFSSFTACYGYDFYSIFEASGEWLRVVNLYSCIKNLNLPQSVRFAKSTLSRYASQWALAHSDRYYQWKYSDVKSLLSYIAYQRHGPLLSKVVYMTSATEESIEDYCYKRRIILAACGIQGKEAVDCIIRGIHDPAVRNDVMKLKLNCPEEIEIYLQISDQY